MDPNVPLLPEIQSKTIANLSPFTWTNIRLPQFNSLKEKPQSVSQKNRLKSSNVLKPSPLKTIQEKLKQPKQASAENAKTKRQSFKSRQKSARLQLYSTPTEAWQAPLESQRYRLKSKVQRLTKTIQLKRNEQSSRQKKAEVKRIRFLDNKNNMEQYLRANLARAGWSSNTKNSKDKANLLWSNIDKVSDHNELKNGQFYNHLNGSFHLTNKDKLHNIVSGKNYYSKSFLIPNNYEQFGKENNRIAMKCMLKVIAKEIEKFINQDSSQSQLMQVNLWEILQPSFLKHGNQQTAILCKLCMYLQEIRRYYRYHDYFQKFQDYRRLKLNPKEHFYDSLIHNSFAYLQGIKTKYLNIQYKDIDYRLLILLLHYHRLFQEYDQTYHETPPLWIIKPIASSRGAGISIVKAVSQFCLNPDNMWGEYKNKKKYQNKIIQRYISNPYILQKPQEFAGRKFDIRQWVLVSSNKDKPIIYRYHTGYCRFSHEKFSLNKLNKEIHLTNYSVFKNTQEEGSVVPSIMMLQDLFSVAYGDLRNKFHQQINYIITDCVLNCPQIKYQQGCFELFGFDFLIDNNQKVYLLEVNLNPACDAERHVKLKKESEEMTKTMIDLVTQSKPSDKWVKLYGDKDALDSSSDSDFRSMAGRKLKFKPYYQYQLTDDESLLAYIRYRSQVLTRMLQISKKFLLMDTFNKINSQKQLESEPPLKQEDDSNGVIRFVEEKSVSNF